jgi:hypothetical protein
VDASFGEGFIREILHRRSYFGTLRGKGKKKNYLFNADTSMRCRFVRSKGKGSIQSKVREEGRDKEREVRRGSPIPYLWKSLLKVTEKSEGRHAGIMSPSPQGKRVRNIGFLRKQKFLRYAERKNYPAVNNDEQD